MAIKRSRSTMFAKDPDVLPFFSIHPKTKVGSILRGAMFVFLLLALIVTVLASKGIMFIYLYSLSYLIYIVPAFFVSSLVILALFKRMKTTFAKVMVPGVLAFFILSVLITLYTTMSGYYRLSITPKMTHKVDGHSIVFMRACDSLPGETEDEDGNPVIRYRQKTQRFTARVPEQIEGVSFSIEGEISIPEGAQFAIEPEWTNENEMRFYISKDSSGQGKGEIRVTFAPGETSPASPDASEDMVFMSSQESPQKTRRVYLYSQPAYEDAATPSFFALNEHQLIQLYTAYPGVARLFARSDTRVDGFILLQPYSDLRVQYEWAEGEDEVLRIVPAEDCVGASGEIVIHFREKAIPESEGEGA